MADFGTPLDPMQGFKQYADYLQQTAKAGIEQQKLREMQRQLAMNPMIAKGIGALATGQQQPQLPPPPGQTVPPGQPSRGNQVPGMSSGVSGMPGGPGMPQQPGWKGLPQPPQTPPVQAPPVQAPMQVNLGAEWSKLKAAGLNDEAAVQALSQYHQLLAPEDKIALQMMQYELQRNKALSGEKLAREKMKSQADLLQAKIDSAEKIAESRNYTQLATTQARIEGMLTATGMREGGKDKDRELKKRELEIKADYEQARKEALDSLKETRTDKVAVDKITKSMRNLTTRYQALQKQSLLVDSDEDKAVIKQQMDDIQAMLDLQQQKLDMVGQQQTVKPSGQSVTDEADAIIGQ